MQRSFPKNMGSLEGVFAFVSECLSSYSADPGTAYVINLAVEEFFTNMVKYAPEGTHDVDVGLEQHDNTVVVTMVDRNVDQFDVTLPRPVDTSLPLEDRTPGGLGVHLVRQMVDSLDYTYANRCSTITFTKTMENH